MTEADELVLKIFEQITQPIIWVLFGVAFIVFIWGVAETIRSAGSEEGREKGRQHIMWGILGLFIMASVFGITQVIINTLGLSGEDVPPLQPDSLR